MNECRKSSRLLRWLEAGNCTDFLAWLFHVYQLLTYPKLAGEWHLEAEEIRRSSGGFQPRGSWKLHTLYSSFALSFKGASVRIGELTVPKPRKIIRDNTKNKDKLTLFIWLSLIGLWGWNVTICDIYENFSGSLASCRDRLLQQQCKSSTSVSNNWRLAASNPQGCLPVIYTIIIQSKLFSILKEC